MNSRRQRIWLYGSSFFVRLLLLLVAEWQDQHLEVKYTDIDYHVFTDAAHCIANGGSPYDRETYRYTPLLAYLLLPNVWLHSLWGKIIFCISDLVVGRLIEASVIQQQSPTFPHAAKDARCKTDPLIPTAFWLLNPLVINFSTRGSADAIVSVLVLATVFFIFQRQPLYAGVFHGLAVHFKIYPIIFSLAYLVALASPSVPILAITTNEGRSGACKSRLGHLWCHFVTLERCLFTLSSAGVFTLLTVVCWLLHGKDFLREGFLYHMTRTDNRHNFSPWFYPIYLDFENDLSRKMLGMVAFLPQFLLLLITSISFGRHLPFCIAVQTLIFVTFNKVCTAQYFSWYLSVFPAAATSLGLRWRTGLMTVGLWLVGLLLWLLSAYNLEFQGINTFWWIWMASLLFLAANVALISSILLTSCLSSSAPLSRNGRT